jgi:two-component system CheB/CheR fusion protein
MPKMSGIEALDEIIKINPKAKIIMQTAHAMEEEKELCFEKGCIDFISKPIIKKELYRKLNKWVHDTP